ncbi:GNAT family N-acetyltransferase [Falsiroseomonas oryzae]|uniref:GNAT family N-acetyltransferase n=1 Tax=Falsiroseomonas oryzae TaxID=2766473 RepID=UPI0022EB32A2|nr:GNAT family N-acetyltransferase [Roseomonas sp. MO-31]
MAEIVAAGPADRPALVALLAEMARFYAEKRDALTLAEAAVALTSPAGKAGPFCLLARRQGAAAGFVSLSGFFPAFDFTWGLLLKDVFVAEAQRGTETARELMTAAAGFAARGGYSRLDWTTDGTNARAQAFYRAIGVPVADKLLYRLDGARLASAARGTWPARITE